MARRNKASTDPAAQAAAGNGSTQGTRTGSEQGTSNETNVLLKKLMEAVQGLQAQQAQQTASPAMAFSQEQKTLINNAIANKADMDDVKQMMLRFKMFNEFSDPDSELYKSLSDGTMEKYLAERGQKKESEAAAQAKRRQQELESSLKKYAMPAWMQALQFAMNAGGEVASMFGNISQSYRSNLAQAMMNAANSGTPGISSERKAAFGDPLEGAGYLGTAKALKQQHIGNRNQYVGNAINSVLKSIAGGLNAEQQIQRQYRTQMELGPSQEFYRTLYNRTRDANNITKDLGI